MPYALLSPLRGSQSAAPKRASDEASPVIDQRKRQVLSQRHAGRADTESDKKNFENSADTTSAAADARAAAAAAAAGCSKKFLMKIHVLEAKRTSLAKLGPRQHLRHLDCTTPLGASRGWAIGGGTGVVDCAIDKLACGGSAGLDCPSGRLRLRTLKLRMQVEALRSGNQMHCFLSVMHLVRLAVPVRCLAKKEKKSAIWGWPSCPSAVIPRIGLSPEALEP
ncbi:hypothetical protein PaG_04317 [Moesziomyces aphidis]|uniref:Uncharacterized protein n=1 Tax=Moesziomyces aphidis TaxID=84754 RepID=W3VJ68_MOEAP|nr:hypothetical protein PaG_04317 [Moesziomyces aphidis]